MPPIVTRAEWGAKPRKGSPSPLNTDLVTVHWEGPAMGTFPHSKCADKVRGIQTFHMAPEPHGRGWSDIAYTGVVCPHGYVFEGRGPGVRTGANGTNEGNSSAYALCALVGVGDPIPPALLDGIADGVAWLGGKHTNAHRDWKPTACPGDSLTHHAHTGRFTAGSSAKPTPTPTPGDELTVAQIDDILKRLEAIELRVIQIQQETVGTIDGDGKSRMDRLAKTIDGIAADVKA
jgi:hypothetical protein